MELLLAVRLTGTCRILAIAMGALAFLAWTRASASDGPFEMVIASATADSPRNSEGDLVALKDGTLLAAWSEFYGGNRDDSAGRISARKSSDGGRTWGPKWTIVENSGRQNVMSVSFLRLDSGDLLLFYLEKHSTANLDVLVRRSRDEGVTWSEPVLVTRDEGYWVMNNARVIQLSNGRIVCPTAMTDQVWTKDHRFRSICFYSDDDGATWHRSAGAVTAPKRGAMEPGLIATADGGLLQYVRTQTGKQWYSKSNDGGDTWIPAKSWTLVSPEAPFTVAPSPLANQWIAIGNPNVDPSADHLGYRTPLVAVTSADGGTTWSDPKSIESDPVLTYSYTSIDFVEGRALLTYYVSDDQRRLSWKFKSLPLSWFPEPPTEPATDRSTKARAAFSSRLDRDNLLQYHNDRGEIREVKLPSQWIHRREEILRGMCTVMGNLPPDDRRVDLDWEVSNEVDMGSYVRRLITFQSEPGSRTPAYLCIPKGAIDGTLKCSAVLCLHPTDNVNGHKVVVGLGGRENRQYAAELAKRGYVTIAPAYPHLANYFPNLAKLGYDSGTMKAIWDNTRAIDLLESLPFVNAKRGVGAIGHSLGGHNAIFTAAFDDRISVIVSSCGFDAFPDYFEGTERVWFFGKGWCQTRYMPRMSNYRENISAVPFDFTELLGVLAPRPTFINAPLWDGNFRSSSVDRCVSAAAPIDRLLGVPDRIQIEHPDCEHDFPEPIRIRAYELIDRVLQTKPNN